MNIRRKVFIPEVEAPIILKQHKYDFSKDCCEELEHFAQLHMYDERKQFKESWTKWVESNQSLINAEKNSCPDYDGDIVEKMFVSVRYYYRKKALKNCKTTSPHGTEPIKKPRKAYVSLDRHFLALIDKYLFELIQETLNTKTMISDTIPAYAFELFCEQHIHDIEKIECSVIKLKKTFKNRYYMMSRELADV